MGLFLWSHMYIYIYIYYNFGTCALPSRQDKDPRIVWLQTAWLNYCPKVRRCCLMLVVFTHMTLCLLPHTSYLFVQSQDVDIVSQHTWPLLKDTYVVLQPQHVLVIQQALHCSCAEHVCMCVCVFTNTSLCLFNNKTVLSSKRSTWLLFTSQTSRLHDQDSNNCMTPFAGFHDRDWSHPILDSWPPLVPELANVFPSLMFCAGCIAAAPPHDHMLKLEGAIVTAAPRSRLYPFPQAHRQPWQRRITLPLFRPHVVRWSMMALWLILSLLIWWRKTAMMPMCPHMIRWLTWPTCQVQFVYFLVVCCFSICFVLLPPLFPVTLCVIQSYYIYIYIYIYIYDVLPRMCVYVYCYMY